MMTPTRRASHTHSPSLLPLLLMISDTRSPRRTDTQRRTCANGSFSRVVCVYDLFSRQLLQHRDACPSLSLSDLEGVRTASLSLAKRAGAARESALDSANDACVCAHPCVHRESCSVLQRDSRDADDRST